MSGGGFDVILDVTFFLIVVWFFEKSFVYAGLSPILGAIFAGIFMGPQGVDVVPYWCTKADNDTCEEPTPFVLLGMLGVTFMISESGTHFDYNKVKTVLGKSVIVAILGTFVPIGLGILVMSLIGFEAFPVGFATGASLAPTSVGIAIKLLSSHKQLNSMPGQTIVTAAFIDDVFSLVVLVLLITLAAGSPSASQIILPIVFCFTFLGISGYLAVNVWPHTIPQFVLSRFAHNKEHSPRDMVHLGLMMVFLVFFCWVGSLIGSHLLGAFAAGMSFSQVHRSHYVWRRQMKRVQSWCVRMFFAASIGFIIPIRIMFNAESIWKGLILGTCAILGKIVAGLHTGEFKWVIGLAMVARGEFSFLVAETSLKTCYESGRRRLAGSAALCDESMLSEDAFAVVVWSHLICLIVAPNAFEWVLKRAFRNKQRSGISRFKIKAEGPYHRGVNFEIMDVLHNMHLDVLEAKMECDNEVACGEWTVEVTDKTDELDVDKIHEVEHEIQEAINDDETQITISYDWTNDNSNWDIPSPIFDPMDGSPSSKIPTMGNSKRLSQKRRDQLKVNKLPSQKKLKELNESWMEIRIMSSHDKTIVTEILETLDGMELHIMKGHTEEHHNHEVEVFFVKCPRDGSVSKELAKDTLKRVFNKHGMRCQIMIKRVMANEVYCSTNPPRTATGLLAMSTRSLLDDIEEGYEIQIDVNHAERDPHIVARISRELTNRGLDVKNFDMDESDKGEHHLSISMFVRGKKAPNKNTQVQIRTTIEDVLREQNFSEVKVVVDLVTLREMHKLSKHLKQTEELQREPSNRENSADATQTTHNLESEEGVRLEGVEVDCESNPKSKVLNGDDQVPAGDVAESAEREPLVPKEGA